MFSHNNKMSDSTSIVVQLDKARQLLEISNNIYDCKVLFTIETENDTPFEFNVIDEDAMKKNTYTMNKVDNGYVSGTAKNVLKPTYLAIACTTPCRATVTLQQIRNATAAATTPVFFNPLTKSTPKNISAAYHPTQAAPPPSTTQVAFYRKKSFLIFAAVLALGVGYWYMKRGKKDSGASDKKAAAAKIKSSVISNDPTSNDESSFGF
jgi:hypothetical protein